jgi:hypothetical protein
MNSSKSTKLFVQFCGVSLLVLAGLGFSILLQPSCPQWLDVIASPLFVMTIWFGLNFFYKPESKPELKVEPELFTLEELRMAFDDAFDDGYNYAMSVKEDEASDSSAGQCN